MTPNLKVPCSKNNLKDIRKFVIETLSDLGLSDSEVNLLVLAVDEVCSNLIIHSNHCNEREFIEILIKVDEKGILFEIHDKGNAFNPVEYEEPLVSTIIKEKRKGGLGLMLVKRIMDHIEFDQMEDHNVCRLYKKL